MLLPVPGLQETGSSAAYCRLQAQPGPHWHCGPQAQAGVGAACCAGRSWQPQVQPGPGHAVQLQGFVVVVAFMAFLLC
jgi:hypothetical protein